MSPAPVLVAASAGSGKTYRLTTVVTEAVSPGSANPATLDGLVAVTYTRKAHAELAGRIRRSLVETGAYDEALRLPVAFIGTVHGVCLRLLQEFALDAGLSPYVEVLPEDRGQRLRAALESSLDDTFLRHMDQLARRLAIFWDARVRRHDWVRRAAEVMELARSNRIPPDALPAMAARSVNGLLTLFPSPPNASADDLESTFTAELDVAIDRLRAADDDTQVTADALEALVEIRRRRALGELVWGDWARAARSAPGAASRDAVAQLRVAAGRYQVHPGLRADLRDFTTGVYEAVRLAMRGYADWKARRRVVDYVDMIDRAVTLLDDQGVGAELAARLDLAVVDEFQDTSPLQLALFAKVHQLAGRSVWVGDAKQCIFEYAGADPLLLDAVGDWIAAEGGAPERLTQNYRSRPELVTACSELFAQAFAAHGWGDADVRTHPVRQTPAKLSPTPPFGAWWLQTRTAEEDALAIAEGTRRLLDSPELTPVVDRHTGAVRPVRAQDIGIIVATNAEAKRIAGALYRCGIRTAVARDGLFATPEGVFVEAALRWLLSSRDRLARATLEALAGWNGVGPDAWLESILRRTEADEPAPWLQSLAVLREQLAVLTPAETLDRVLHLSDMASLCARWPDPAQRIGNLEALRALAGAYEERCARHREAATVAGLLRYFGEARQPVIVQDEERASDEQYVQAGEDAVTVCTYHRAKGLEWPVVVLASLDRKEKREAFDVCPESDGPGFDPASPLGGRWIRFWAWPFGQQKKVPLADAAASSPEGQRVALRESRERVRLLYVGFTRARDHLVLAARLKKTGVATRWLDELTGPTGRPLLALPVRAPEGATDAVAITAANGAELRAPCRVSLLDAPDPGSVPHPAPVRFARPTERSVERARFRIVPSALTGDPVTLPPLVVRRIERPGPGLPLLRPPSDWEAFGSAVHRFLAADPDGDDVARLVLAQRILEETGQADVIQPASLVAASTGLRAHVAARWPAATAAREVPVTAFLDTPGGRRRLEGMIDLLLTLDDGVVLVDHKTYPAPNDGAIRARAVEFSPQVSAYAEALRLCGHAIRGAFLHFPISGAWVELAEVPGS